MIVLTRSEAERVLGRSPDVSHSALEPYPLKDGTYWLPDDVINDPANRDIHAFLVSKQSPGNPDPRLTNWNMEDAREAAAYHDAVLHWNDGNQRTEAA